MITMARLLTVLDLFLIGISWVDYIDIGIRIASGAAAILVAYFAIQAYRAQKRLSDKRYEEMIKNNGKDKK